MATAENAKIQYESGQDLVPFVALTNTGDNRVFESADPLWSARYAPEVFPNGVATGGLIIPAAGDDAVALGAATVYIGGELKNVTPVASQALVRASAGDTHVKAAITVNAAGVYAVVYGEEHTEFTNDRGQDGGPPYILPDSVLVGEVWLAGASPAPVVANDIKQVPGTNLERYDYPTLQVQRYKVQNGILGNAGVTFDADLPLIHSAASPVVPVTKAVFAQYYEPTFTDIPIAADFVPPETSHSVTSTEAYGVTIGASSRSLGQGTFTAYLNTGIDDGLLDMTDENLFFKFFQDRLRSLPFILAQGILGVSRTFPAGGGQISAACTISADRAGENIKG